MRLIDDNDELKRGKTYTKAAVISIAAIVLVVVCVVFMNRSSFKNITGISAKSVASNVFFENETEIENNDFIISSSEKVRVSDLDFYDLYPKEDENAVNEIEEESVSEEKKEKLSESEDGKHTLVVNPDKTEEWVTINQYIPKNMYDLTNLINSGGRMKYYEDNKCVSSFGVEISDDEDYVDFNKLKKDGCDFVMLRVGARGYQSGQISIDNYFSQNIKRATDAGLDVGVYFLSQAVSVEEAVEEANYVIVQVGEYKLTYPVAFMMKNKATDVSRIDSLTKTKRTDIATAFLNTVKNAGFKPMLYGDKYWLIKNYDMSKLVGDFDIWYSEIGADLPDYPYKYTIWEYDENSLIDGISDTVKFNISFTDYKLK